MTFHTEMALQGNLAELNSLISVDIKKSTDSKDSDSSKTGIKASTNPHKEASFITTVKKEVQKFEKANIGNSKQTKKKMKKGIFISYSPDADFLEKKFVVEAVRQLKENNLSDDIWFDKDEKILDSPCWFSHRMKALEKARAAVIMLSDSYLACPVSLYESKALMERYNEDTESVRIFLVIYQLGEGRNIPKHYQHLMTTAVNLATPEYSKLSTAEKVSAVVGSLMMSLEEYASIHAVPMPASAPDDNFTGEYKHKKISQWSASDLQEWLFNLGIREFYRQSLAENMIDGHLLMALTDSDMSTQLSIDSKVARKKIMQQVLAVLDKEHKLPDNWHLRARTQRPRPHSVYLIYDPNDVRLAQNFKLDLSKKGLQVVHHTRLGDSKEEFLQLNAGQLAPASQVLVLMTEASCNSPFVFHEVLFADWLGKKLLTAVFRNMWCTLRASLKAVLGECPAVDFQNRMYRESMEVLQHHLKPIRNVSGVVLEQTYLTKMAEGIQPLALLGITQGGREAAAATGSIFISHQWDVQSRVEQIQTILQVNGMTSWADTSTTALGSLLRSSSSIGARVSASAPSLPAAAALIDTPDTLQALVHRSIKSAALLICCITPKYIQTESCVKDLIQANTHNKPIIPVLLQFTPWPPEGAAPSLRKFLARFTPVDLSNEKLFKLNMPVLLDRLKKTLNTKP